MFTREQREARMMAAWEAHLAKFATPQVTKDASRMMAVWEAHLEKFTTPQVTKDACFLAFLSGWVGGHELGAEEVAESAKEKLVELTEAALKRLGGE